MTYLPQHLRTQPENEINDFQQDRISRWRRGELASGGPDAKPGCPSCKRPLHVDTNGIILCINSRCVYYSPGVNPSDSWRLALARAHRQQEARLSASIYEVVRAA